MWEHTVVVVDAECSGRNERGCSAKGFKGGSGRVQQVWMGCAQRLDDAVKVILQVHPAGSECLHNASLLKEMEGPACSEQGMASM